jgi:WD40 repeat protein
LRMHTDWILSLAFSPEGLLLASGDRFGGLQVWETESGKEFHTLRGHVGAVSALSWSADSEQLVSAGQDASLRLWDMHEGAQRARWDAGVGGILAVECDVTGRVVCGGRDRKLAVWENPQGRLQQMSIPDEVIKLGVSHDSSHVIAGDAAGNIAVYTIGNGQLAGNLSLPLTPAISAAETARPTATHSAATQVISRQPSRPQRESGSLHAEIAAADAEARQTASELAEVRDALAAAESAVKSAEDSLKTLRQSATKLAVVVSSREAAARLAAHKAAELRAKAESTETASADDSADPRTRRERMQQRLNEKRSLLESTKALSERIGHAAALSPRDKGLESAAKLAAELRRKLAADVEETTNELRLLEAESGSARK